MQLGLLSMALLLAACTLTQSDFEPEPAQLGSNLFPGGNAGASAVPSCARDAGCCSGADCAAGQVCRAGVCTASDAGPAMCSGPDCEGPPGNVALGGSCDDDVTNQDETDTDCGGSCARPCAAGQGCRADADCEEDLFCPLDAGRCRSVSCSDEVLNGNEVVADCGGGECTGCPDGTACSAAVDCESGFCGPDGRCAATCNDEVRNQGEVDVDCAGPCAARCGVRDNCSAAADCLSGVCRVGGCPPGVATCCQVPTCNDDVANGSEPVVDCGNLACGLCLIGSGCLQDQNCASGFCQQGSCADPGTCTDGAQNGTESDTDCGGDRCPNCLDLRSCREDADCNNNNCDPNGICISCGDATLNGTETDEDCGGDDPFCRRCNPGESCEITSDCLAGSICQNGFC